MRDFLRNLPAMAGITMLGFTGGLFTAFLAAEPVPTPVQRALITCDWVPAEYMSDCVSLALRPGAGGTAERPALDRGPALVNGCRPYLGAALRSCLTQPLG